MIRRSTSSIVSRPFARAQSRASFSESMVLRNLPLIKASGPKTCASMRLKAPRIAFSIESLRRLSRCFRTALATRTAMTAPPACTRRSAIQRLGSTVNLQRLKGQEQPQRDGRQVNCRNGAPMTDRPPKPPETVGQPIGLTVRKGAIGDSNFTLNGGGPLDQTVIELVVSLVVSDETQRGRQAKHREGQRSWRLVLGLESGAGQGGQGQKAEQLETDVRQSPKVAADLGIFLQQRLPAVLLILGGFVRLAFHGSPDAVGASRRQPASTRKAIRAANAL